MSDSLFTFPIVSHLHHISGFQQQSTFAIGDVWQLPEIFLVVKTERCFSHLASRGQGCCQTARNSQDSPTLKNRLAPVSTGPGLRNPSYALITLHKKVKYLIIRIFSKGKVYHGFSLNNHIKHTQSLITDFPGVTVRRSCLPRA